MADPVHKEPESETLREPESETPNTNLETQPEQLPAPNRRSHTIPTPLLFGLALLVGLAALLLMLAATGF